MWLRATTLALLAILTGAAGAGAGAPRHDAAGHALANVERLQKGGGIRKRHQTTPTFAHLSAPRPRLSVDARQPAESLLARPDDPQPDVADAHKWTGPEAGSSPRCTTHFCVHFTNVGADASDATYAQSMANILENEVLTCENGTAASACAGSPGLGWRDAAADGGLGGGDTVDVYIEDLFPQRIFGYVALDPGQTQDASVPHHAYMVMDRDYSRFGDGSAASGLAAERVTAAHEYNHVLQNAYDYLEDPWMFESTAVYMEDKVYPAVNDYLRYVESWVTNAHQPLTAFPSTNLKGYGSAVWNHWLDHRFGSPLVRGAWEQSLGAGDFAPAAYGAAVTAAGGAGFSDEFARFAAAVAEWNAPGSGFPDHYPDVPRDASLPVGSQVDRLAVPHTTFALFDVPIPAAPTIRLTATLPSGTAGAVALVGRTGADPAGGAVTTNLTPMASGGTAAVSLEDPGQFGRITGVVVNGDPSRGGFDPQAADWIFTKDASDVAVSLAGPGAPVVTTRPATLVRDHSAFVNGGVDPHLIDSRWSFEYGKTTGYGSSTEPRPAVAATVGSAPVGAPLGDLKADTTYHYRVVASNSAGVTRGADMTFRTARDVTKPTVSFAVKRQRIRSVRTRGLVYRGRCSERCIGRAQLTVSRSLGRRLGTTTVLGNSRIRLEPRRRSAPLRLRATEGGQKRLAGARKSFTAILNIRVAAGSGNRVAVHRRVKLSR